MTLPKWIEEKKHRNITHKDLLEVIAVEALQFITTDNRHGIKVNPACKCFVCTGKDALRRIEKLGNP